MPFCFQLSNMDYYNAISPAYNELHSAEQLEKAAIIRSGCKFEGLLLDIGAGTGLCTKQFEKMAECIALDPAIEMLKQYKGMKVAARAEQLPFKTGSFDCIVSITALHHACLEKAKSEIERAAKKGAKIAISFFKRAKNFPEAEELFKDFKKFDSEKDMVFIKQ